MTFSDKAGHVWTRDGIDTIGIGLQVEVNKEQLGFFISYLPTVLLRVARTRSIQGRILR